jgi:phosphate/sulfate permease
MKSSPWAAIFGVLSGVVTAVGLFFSGMFILCAVLGARIMESVSNMGSGMDDPEALVQSYEKYSRDLDSIGTTGIVGIIIILVLSILIGALFGRFVFSLIKKRCVGQIDDPPDSMLHTDLSNYAKPASTEKKQVLEPPKAVELPPVLPTTATCVWCLEEVKTGARVCKHCGKNPSE